MKERDRAIYLARLSGEDVSKIARDHGISRQMAHRILARIRDSGIQARVGVAPNTVSGPFTPDEIGDALRAYAESMGIR